jgi:hypothetical protein
VLDCRILDTVSKPILTGMVSSLNTLPLTELFLSLSVSCGTQDLFHLFREGVTKTYTRIFTLIGGLAFVSPLGRIFSFCGEKLFICLYQNGVKP